MEGACWDDAVHSIDGMARMVKQRMPPSNVSYHILLVIAFLAFIVNITHMLQLDISLQRQQSVVREVAKASAVAKSEATSHAATEKISHKPIPKRKEGIQKDLVQAGDYIYYRNEADWDSAPIVVESHKLVFFTVPKVGCTVWKQLFRRMEGHSDWQSQELDLFLPHDPKHNGLKYLYHYSLERASEIMTSPEWTRAIMVRDPKQRFLSAFLDKAVSNDHKHIIHRCCPDQNCVDKSQDLPGFLRLCSVCSDQHWRAQNERVDYKFWPYMDAVGHVETAAADAKSLLQRIGAWDEFGAKGWGQDGTLPIFGSKDSGSAGEHATYAEWQVWKWYTPEIERSVERFYQGDYDNPLFNFTQDQCLTCTNK